MPVLRVAQVPDLRSCIIEISMIRILFLLILAVVCPLFAAAPDKEASRELKTYYDSLPAPNFPAFDQAQAMALVTLPLSCIDRPQALPEQRVDYLWVHDTKPHLADSYDKNRAFYGCFDWHSAVNSTWTMVAVLKQFPGIPVGPLIREKLKEHLGKKNIEGEMEFFKSARNFEVPYGYAWLLRLYAELLAWDDPEAKTWAQNMLPMVQQFSKKLADYYKDLPFPTRTGMHPNTAFSISLLLDYTEIANDTALREIALKTANRFFGNDRSCATSYEPQGTDFLSPCLAEAQLMSKVLDRGHFQAWFNDFLPPLYSQDFKPLTAPVDVSGITKEDLQAGKSHLIGVAFSRSMAMADVVRMLPPEDPRVPVLRRLAIINGWSGFQALTAAGYYGSHWLATYAVLCTRAIAAAARTP
jgi:hypothetical protein